MGWIDNQSEPSRLAPYQQRKTKNRKSESPASIVRYAYPVYQGTRKILLQRAQNYFSLYALDRLDFCCGITQPTTGNRKEHPVPRRRPLHSTAKATSLLRWCVVGYSGALPRTPASPKEQNFSIEFVRYAWYNL